MENNEVKPEPLDDDTEEFFDHPKTNSVQDG